MLCSLFWWDIVVVRQRGSCRTVYLVTPQDPYCACVRALASLPPTERLVWRAELRGLDLLCFMLAFVAR